MTRHIIAATCAFGIESVLSDELKSLGYDGLNTENGRVLFQGDDRDIARCNINLRTADRLFIRLAEFRAFDFEELFQGVLGIDWENFIPMEGIMHVVGKSVRSKLHSVPDCQSITKRAVIEAMRRKHKIEIFEEKGPLYRIEVALNRDTATISLDTSGEGLHRRGYRLSRGEAPLRENIAAAVVLLSRWDKTRPFIDPFCGSGTIPIEAAMIGRRIAPGIRRKFASEGWVSIPDRIWKTAREEARDLENIDSFSIMASDIDRHVFDSARINAREAGVEGNIIFQRKSVSELSSRKKYGCVVCNPPYGKRLSTGTEAAGIYREMGKVFPGLDTWSCFILSGNEDFERHFGRKADRNRKLYNGKIKTYLYQYLGPLPGKR
ncbi:MAG: class I SAM-dependent RNA methyltransferase [Spirochaetes bacterium]|jgi:putative N6-adenine-specific DNA methylase|nr:class I SAM-dependent RNA methyltransferase [Spirochaetota bacterium]